MVKDSKEAVRVISSDSLFPRLKHDKHFRVTSNSNETYNCIAWAMRLRDRWVDPKSAAGHWWPIKISDTSMNKEELISAFEALKFKKCINSKREFWYDKVSLYCHPISDKWTHAARILAPNEYHSKLGQLWDIHHSDGNVLHNPKNLVVTYGGEYQIMKRHKILRFYSLWLTICRFVYNICAD